MRPLLNQQSVRNALQIISWSAIIGTSAYILFCYISGRLIKLEQAGMTLIVLLSILLALYVVKSAQKALTFALVVIHLGLLITWGNIIPFIQFLPFLISFLLVTSQQEKIAKYYLAGSVLATVLEFIQILPVTNNAIIEVGPINLFLILLLQSTVYFVWMYVLQLYTIVSEYNFLGLENIGTGVSKRFFQSTLAKGLYMSILLHFINNVLNSHVWGTELSRKRIEILELLGESERICKTKPYTLCKILSLAGIRGNKSSDYPLSTHEAKVLLILLLNIQDNYRKFCKNTKVAVQVVGQKICLEFTGLPMDTSSPASPVVPWNRNLGSMKQFLQLTQAGSIETKVGAAFETRLEIELAENN